MKHILFFDEYNSTDIKPLGLLSRYFELTQKNIFEFLVQDKILKNIPCPACKKQNESIAFKKLGLTYVHCTHCYSLYISPRPDDKVLENYYLNSEARIFWREELSQKTAQRRTEKIIHPRLQWILESIEEYYPRASHFMDINTSQYAYVEELEKTSFSHKTLVHPFLPLPHVTPLNIIPTPWWEISFKEEADIISLFEVCDHTSDIDLLFSKIHQMLKPNGLCFLTTILLGFDIYTLWEHAPNVYPPDRLNIFSVEGFKCLFERQGFECLEFSTPGIFDIDNVREAMNHSIPVPPFIEYLIKNKNDGIKKSFQEFLQTNLLSSYGRIVLRKK